jgi:hypothetical protein
MNCIIIILNLLILMIYGANGLLELQAQIPASKPGKIFLLQEETTETVKAIQLESSYLGKVVKYPINLRSTFK